MKIDRLPNFQGGLLTGQIRETAEKKWYLRGIEKMEFQVVFWRRTGRTFKCKTDRWK